MTWEQAVEWLRGQPGEQELVRACYYDDPVEEAASRFHRSEEWQEIADTFHDRFPCRVLDIGAGRGISSYAFAREGCNVVALEPDPSHLVGSAAIKTLAERTNASIPTVRGFGESLPFKDGTFDMVYGRAVLHHSRNLETLCRNAAGVLKPGGIFIATREHVISRPDDLDAFLNSHPLHKFYGGENAYLLRDYRDSIEAAGLKLLDIVGPCESVINFAPMSREENKDSVASLLSRFVGKKAARILVDIPVTFKYISRLLSSRSNIPGRLYSFIAVKS